MTLVEQIQREALDHSIPVSQLLRRIKLVSVKLKQPKVESWVDHELSGYPGEVPDYRMVRGQPKAFNPYNGWIPISGTTEFMESISTRGVNSPIAALESLITKDTKGPLQMPFPPSLINSINEGQDIHFAEMTLFISPGIVVSIVDRVRGLALEWALDLEKAGIMGGEFSFTPDEERKAEGATIRIGTMIGNLNSGDLNGKFSRVNFNSEDRSKNEDKYEVLFSEIRSSLSSSIGDEEELAEALSRLEDLQNSHGTSGFLAAYKNFMSSMSDHMTILLPFIPALTTMLSG